MEPEKNLQTIFDEAMKQKNISYEKLAILTNIQEKYIIALQNMDTKNLPAFPYVRGYLKKICGILEINFEELWKEYKKELNYKTSGAFDKLPSNRFTIKKISKKNVAFAVTAIILLIFLILNFNNLFGKPPLTITFPSQAISTSSDASINLTGIINPSDKLTINDKEITTDSNGNFQSIYELRPGLNTIKFKVKKMAGPENSEIRQVILEATTTPNL
jgi:cytoskeletal protein RodZ